MTTFIRYLFDSEVELVKPLKIIIIFFFFLVGVVVGGGGWKSIVEKY